LTEKNFKRTGVPPSLKKMETNTLRFIKSFPGTTEYTRKPLGPLHLERRNVGRLETDKNTLIATRNVPIMLESEKVIGNVIKKSEEKPSEKQEPVIKVPIKVEYAQGVTVTGPGSLVADNRKNDKQESLKSTSVADLEAQVKRILGDKSLRDSWMTAIHEKGRHDVPVTREKAKSETDTKEGSRGLWQGNVSIPGSEEKVGSKTPSALTQQTLAKKSSGGTTDANTSFRHCPVHGHKRSSVDSATLSAPSLLQRNLIAGLSLEARNSTRTLDRQQQHSKPTKEAESNTERDRFFLENIPKTSSLDTTPDSPFSPQRFKRSWSLRTPRPKTALPTQSASNGYKDPINVPEYFLFKPENDLPKSTHQMDNMTEKSDKTWSKGTQHGILKPPGKKSFLKKHVEFVNSLGEVDQIRYF